MALFSLWSLDEVLELEKKEYIYKIKIITTHQKIEPTQNIIIFEKFKEVVLFIHLNERKYG